MSSESLTPSRGIGAQMAAMEQRAKLKSAAEKKLADELATEQPSPPQIALQLPLFPLDKSAMPHKWTRSSLFMSISSGRRARFVKTRLASRDDLSMIYTGEQLDMADNDVFLHALRLAQFKPAGEPIYFVRSQFIESIGRTPGTTSYKWLKDSLQRLASATLFIENAAGDGRMCRLINELAWKRQSEEFWLSLDPEIMHFFGKHELAHIDFNARLELKAPLAKWLQNYASGHRAGDWHCISVENLRDWSGAGEMRNFLSKARGLPKALAELEAVGVIEEFVFYTRKNGRDNERMVKWWRPSDLGKWLRDYAEGQPAGWHKTSVESIRGPSSYRTLKGFLAKGRGLNRAIHELEKSGVIEKSEIYSELDSSGKQVVLVRWWRK